MVRIAVFTLLLFSSASVSQPDAGILPDQQEDQWFIGIEGGLGIGHLDRSFPGQEMEVFGVDTLRRGGEQDGAGIRAGIGRRITEDFSAVVYGGTSILFPGVFLDNHGPFIPSELLYTIAETSLGAEVHYRLARLGGGYSFYSGTASLRPDKREGAPSGDEWEGDLANTGGPHLVLGISSCRDRTVGAGLDMIWRSIVLEFLETPTGVIPERITRDMIEVRLSLQIRAFVF